MGVVMRVKQVSANYKISEILQVHELSNSEMF